MAKAVYCCILCQQVKLLSFCENDGNTPGNRVRTGSHYRTLIIILQGLRVAQVAVTERWP